MGARVDPAAAAVLLAVKGDRPATEEDLRLLTEAIDLYLQ
jgi:hypothetical protein